MKRLRRKGPHRRRRDQRALDFLRAMFSLGSIVSLLPVTEATAKRGKGAQA